MKVYRVATTILAACLLLGVPLLLPTLHAHEHQTSANRDDCHVCSFNKHAPALTNEGSPQPVVVVTGTLCGPGTDTTLRSLPAHCCAERAPPTLS